MGSDAAREQRQANWARETAEKLAGTLTLSQEDRAALVGNLGRLVEQASRGRERQVAARLFATAYPDNPDYVASLVKKRSRYLRFSDEALPDENRKGLYAAKGKSFVLLLRAFCQLQHEGAPSDAQFAQALEKLVRGTSFENNTQTLVQGDRRPREVVQSLFHQATRRIDQACDLVGYFREVTEHAMDVYREPLVEWRTRDGMEFRRFLGLSYAEPDPDKAGRPLPDSYLLPAVRIARTYWRRDLLCLPHCFEAARLEGIESDTERQEIVSEFARERGLLGIDWNEYEDPFEGKALHGAFYREFYESHSLDLMLGFGTDPTDLMAGLFTSNWENDGGGDSELLTSPAADNPRDKARSDRMLEGLYAWEYDAGYIQIGDKVHIARSMQQHGEKTMESWWGGEPEIGYSETEWHSPEWNRFAEELHPVGSRMGWQLLTLRTLPWESFFNVLAPPWNGREPLEYTSASRRWDRGGPIGIRPAIAAPEGPVNAPDNTIAALLLRNLAYADEPARIDTRLLAEARKRTDALRTLREDRMTQFEQALRSRGFKL